MTSALLIVEALGELNIYLGAVCLSLILQPWLESLQEGNTR